MLPTSSRRYQAASALAVVALGGVAGWSANGQILPYLNANAVIAITGAAAIAAIFVIGNRVPLLPFAALVVMFPVGDYLRKSGSGDPRLILVRDILLFIGVLILSARAMPWRDVAHASWPWLRPLILFMAWFFVAAVNSALFEHVSSALIGFRLYFEYVPVICVGWYVAQDPTRLRRAVVFLSVVLCGTSVFGILQSVLGPSFLHGSSSASDLFQHLDLLRTTAGQTASRVFQPSGLFVEPGRFANWAFINFAFGMALLPHRGLRAWRFVVPIIGVLALFAASNRTTIVSAIVVASFVAGRRIFLDSGRAVRAGALVMLLVATATVGLRTFFPAQYESRVQFVGHSLNFTSGSAEGSVRVPSYIRELLSDVEKGGLVGRGAGTQGLGRQYLGQSQQTQLLTEGGFAVVMVETGVIGFLLWVLWSFAAWRFVRRMSLVRADPLAESLRTLGVAVGAQLFLNLFLGISAIQDAVFGSWLFVVLGFAAAVGVSDTSPADGDQLPLGQETVALAG